MLFAEDIIQFKNLFVARLKTMLTDEQPGTFVLVLANSRQDRMLRDELQDKLTGTFAALTKRLASGEMKAAPDDLEVFARLQTMKPDQLPVWHFRTEGVWEIASNTMRQYRPVRVSAQKLHSIMQDFDATKFHFNRPFLEPEILWQGQFQDKNLTVFYNKFPFSDYHLLIALAPEENRAQLLTRDAHADICTLVAALATRLPGFGIGFNSLAAGASVNHLHFQGFIRERELPLENSSWHHNGGVRDYPLDVNCFTDTDKSWRYIAQLIRDDIAFNCVYRKDSCYVIPRKYQGTADLPEWLAGAGWLDVAGVITVSDDAVFDSIDANSITAALHQLRQNKNLE